MSRILVVDDEPGMRDLLRILLEKEGHEVLTAADGTAGLAQATSHELDLVISDIKMPGLDGVGLLVRPPRARPHHAGDHGDRLCGVGLRHPGHEAGGLRLPHQALQGGRDQAGHPSRPGGGGGARQKVGPTPPPAAEEPALRGIIGRSPRMVELYKLISRVAQVDSSVLITGESGTGKELVARTIHYNSTRAGKSFVAINCGAIPEDLLESELFGHVKGSFTGAIAHKAGLLEVARDGTVFLDEVAEMSPSLQVKLLRVLQDHIFRRVGGTDDIEVDIRVIAATNKEPAQLIRTGAFREDLYYRLNVISIEMPPLRERREDIPLLAASFLNLFAARSGRNAMRITPEAMDALLAHTWPGQRARAGKRDGAGRGPGGERRGASGESPAQPAAAGSPSPTSRLELAGAPRRASTWNR